MAYLWKFHGTPEDKTEIGKFHATMRQYRLSMRWHDHEAAEMVENGALMIAQILHDRQTSRIN